MKTKEEAFEDYSKLIPSVYEFDETYPWIDFSAGWDAATANHDQEIADFCEWVTTQHGMYPHSWQIMLNKFRQSK